MHIAVPNQKDLYIAQLDKEFQGSAGFNPVNYTFAAQWLLQEKYNLPKALEWINQGPADFPTLTTKAQIQMLMGSSENGMATIDRALHMSDANPTQIHLLGRSLIGIGKKEEALKIFTANYDMNKGAWPTNVGMARGLSAVGRFEEA